MEENINNSAENGTETEIIPDLAPIQDQPKTVELVQLPKEQLTALVDKLKEYQTDLVTMVSTLHQFSSLFSGKTNLLSIGMQIPKLINDPKIIEQFKVLGPILEKYSNGEKTGE